MSRQLRHRMTALGLCGFVLGVPLITLGPASAAPSGGRDRLISFGGGLFGPACGSRPDVESMTVRSGSVVRVVNRTGHAARLRVAGEPRGTIPVGGETEVMFRRGAASVLLTPVCASGPDTGLPVLIRAVPSASAAEPDAASGDPADVAATMRAKSAGTATPARASGSRRTDKGSRQTDANSRRTDPGSRRTDAVTSEPRPTRTGEKDPRRERRDPAGPSPMTSASAADVREGLPARRRTTPRPRPEPISGTENDAPVIPGLPPGGRDTAEPGSAVPYQADVVPPLTETDYLAALGLEPETVPGSSSRSAVTPSVMVGRTVDDRPVGLLALTAVVGVLGVTTAIIRSIVS